ESVRHLVESGVLVGAAGAYSMAHPPAAAQLPDTVRSVLSARIDRLEPADKALLEAASAIGHDVPRPLLEAVGEASPSAVAAVLERLQAAEFLTQTRAAPEAEYSFRHALTLEAAYAGLVRERRRTLDAAIEKGIEERP